MIGAVMTSDHTPVLTESFLCRPKLVKATGHEIFNRSLLVRWIVNIGNGKMVVVVLKVLFADVRSGLSLTMLTVLVIESKVLGMIVNVTIIDIPLVTLPNAPVIGLLLIERV